MCRKKLQNSRIERANVVTEEPVKDEEPGGDRGEEYTLFQIRAGQYKPFQASIKVNGKPVAMEIDTGASVTVVGEDTFKTIQEGDSSVELQRTTVRLRTYTGETIPVQGSALVPVQHNGQSLTLPLIVTTGELSWAGIG